MLCQERGTALSMGRTDQQENQEGNSPRTPEPAAEERRHGMGVSSEHDEGQVQEVDSREQE